ncbi:hypothetical protein ACFWRG_32980 [Micromonospora tulbaghiae]|uniref:Uncharacterized protein n=2 Tax=Streptomyces TaxID=1883 RepID=A0A1E7LT82_9ACTN|nr:hypothetical protein [Streptomyces nanshensis]OEV19412.1 hypothetical protein AN221_16420 [Streptomyces nanshensis]
MTTTPSTRGRTGRADTDTPESEPDQSAEPGSGTPDDETRLRRFLSRVGVRPLGHAEQPVEPEPEPAADRPGQETESAGATRRISMSPGGRLPVPGRTIDLADPPEHQAPAADEPVPAEDEEDSADLTGPSEAQAGGEPAKSTWPPRVSWRRRKDDDQAEGPDAVDADEDRTGPAGGEPDWFRVRKTADPQAPVPEPYEVHNHYYGTGQEPSAPAGEWTGSAGKGRNRSSLTAWWASFTPLQRFILHNGAAATVGAWSWGAFTAEWKTGLPQWTLAVMHDAAASSNEPSTPFIVGGGVILLAAVAGGIVTALVEKWLYRLPSLCAAVRFLTHIPVASAGIAVLLFLPSTF